MSQTQVKTYPDAKRYQRDAEKLGKQGWEVVSVVNQPVKRGCFGTLFFLTHKPKQELIVTYRRD